MWLLDGLVKQARAAVPTLLGLALGLLALSLWSLFGRTPERVYVNTPGATQYVPVPKKVEVIRKVVVPGPGKIELLPVEVVREKMKWPDLPADNILAVGSVPPYRGKTSIAATATIVDNVMKTSLVMHHEKLPLFDFKKEMRLGIFAGTGGAFQGEVAIRPLRIGPVDTVAKVQGTIGGEGKSEVRAFVGAEMDLGL